MNIRQFLPHDFKIFFAYICLRLNPLRSSFRPKKNSKQIVFIVEFPSTRHAKIAFGLREIGWEVVLLYQTPPLYEISKYFSEAKQFFSSRHAVLLASQYSPIAYHCFSSWFFKTSKDVIDAGIGKVVFDSYDILAEGLKDEFVAQWSNQIATERYCFENSDASCHRHLYARYARRDSGYKLSKPIFYPEYCWNAPQLWGGNAQKKLTDGIHCVYIGSIPEKLFYRTTKTSHIINIEFVKELTQKQIHYHMYPFTAGMSQSDQIKFFSIYIIESKRNPFFHFHSFIPYEEMMKEISHYHFGFLGGTEAHLREGDHINKPIVLKTCTINKAFDYLDADIIPIVFGFPLLEKLMGSACLRCDCLDIAEMLSKVSISDFSHMLEHSLPEARLRLSIRKNSHRLAQLYESLD